MVAERPRRSAAPDSYRIAFPELTSSSSGEDESEDDNVEGGAEAGAETTTESNVNNDNGTPDASQVASESAGAVKQAKKKKKKRKEPSPSPDEADDSASGSEFEPEVIKNKDGTVVEVEEEEDDEDFEGVVVEESESGDSAAGDKELDNISIANSEGLESGSETATGKQGLKFGKTRYIFSGDPAADGKTSASKPSQPALRIVGRTLSATAPTFAGPRKSALRKKVYPHLIGAQKKLTSHDLSYGPAFWPPPFLLSKSFDDSAHTPKQGPAQAKASCTESLPTLSDAQRLFHLKRSAYLAFGPVADACIDLGWYKGKWMRSSDGSLERAQRWGGWYDSVTTESSAYEFVQNIE